LLWGVRVGFVVLRALRAFVLKGRRNVTSDTHFRCDVRLAGRDGAPLNDGSTPIDGFTTEARRAQRFTETTNDSCYSLWHFSVSSVPLW